MEGVVASSAYRLFGVEPPESATVNLPRVRTDSEACAVNSAAAASNSSRGLCKMRISGGDGILVAQAVVLTCAQRAAPSNAIRSLVITITGMDSSNACILPLPAKACMNKGPESLASILG